MYTGIMRNVSMQDVKVSTISLEMDPKSNMYKERFCGGSLKDYINLLNANKKPLHSVFGFRKEINGITVEIALQWCVDVYSETILEYGNSIRTSDGGTHVDGVKASITRTLNNLAKKSKVIKEENITLSGEHAREGLTCIVSVNVPNHEFVGQTHSLGNQYVREIVERSVEEYLTEYFELHPNVLECIISKSYNAYKTNLAFKKARELFTSRGVSTLCDVTEKLTNNSSKKSGGGDSSGGATKHNITRRFQTKRTREQLGSDETTSIILGEPLQNTSDTSFEKKSKKPKSCVPSSYLCFSSHENVGCSSIPNPEDINDKTPKDVTRRSEKAKPFIPIGPGFQAEIPIWNAPTKKGKFYGSPGDSTTLRWLGTGVWPTYNLKKKAQHKGVGEGRHDSCSCVSPGSNNCIKQHKKETRDLLEKELGCEFYTMEFDRMGEVVANSWTTKEEQKFDSLVKKNPLENTEGFWEIASMAFPRKSEKDLISYYHNVFLINRMRMFANSSGGEIDSDDDQNGDFLRK